MKSKFFSKVYIFVVFTLFIIISYFFVKIQIDWFGTDILSKDIFLFIKYIGFSIACGIGYSFVGIGVYYILLELKSKKTRKN